MGNQNKCVTTEDIRNQLIWMQVYLKNAEEYTQQFKKKKCKNTKQTQCINYAPESFSLSDRAFSNLLFYFIIKGATQTYLLPLLLLLLWLKDKYFINLIDAFFPQSNNKI